MARLKDPRGGLTAAGRDWFRHKEGAHLKPGVKGAADTPEKMRRKGSFLRRHFANPRGPMVGENGKPTRLALSAHAWGEPVPKTAAAAKKLAAKGARLLERYARSSKKKTAANPAARKRPARASRKSATLKRTRGKNTARKTTPRKKKANATRKTTTARRSQRRVR